MTTTERLALFILDLLPVLNGVCGTTALNLTLTYLNRERTTKILFYALGWWVLTFVFLLSGIERNVIDLSTKSTLQIARSAAFLLFCFLVIIGQVLDWIELLAFQKAKNEAESKLNTQGNVSDAARALVLAAETSIIAAKQAKRAVIAVQKEHATVEPGG